MLALERIRRLHGLSQRELAEKAGVSPATVYELEVGKRPAPRPSTLRKLAQALEVSIPELLGEESPKAQALSPDEGEERRREPDRVELLEELIDYFEDRIEHTRTRMEEFRREQDFGALGTLVQDSLITVAGGSTWVEEEEEDAREVGDESRRERRLRTRVDQLIDELDELSEAMDALIPEEEPPSHPKVFSIAEAQRRKRAG